MLIGQFPVNLDSSLQEIAALQSKQIMLAHDVSSEARDEHGRWTVGGYLKKRKERAKQKEEKRKAKEEAFHNQPLKKKVLKGAASSGAAAATYAGIHGEFAKAVTDYAIKKGIPLSRISHKQVLKFMGVYGAAGAALGAGIQTGIHIHKKGTPKQKKIANAVYIAAGVPIATATAIHGLQSRHHNRIYHKMLDKVNNMNPGPDMRDAKRYAEKFAEMTHKEKQKIIKLGRSRLGNTNSLGRQLKNLASKAILKFKPLKVVKTAGLLLDCSGSGGMSSSSTTFSIPAVVSSKPVKRTIKKFRKHKHKIPQLMAGFSA